MEFNEDLITQVHCCAYEIIIINTHRTGFCCSLLLKAYIYIYILYDRLSEKTQQTHIHTYIHICPSIHVSIFRYATPHPLFAQKMAALRTKSSDLPEVRSRRHEQNSRVIMILTRHSSTTSEHHQPQARKGCYGGRERTVRD